METVNLPEDISEELELRGFKLGQVLKRGCLTRLCRATYCGRSIVAKVVPLPGGPGGRIALIGNYNEYFLYDRYVSRELKHKHLIEIIEAFYNPEVVVFLMEFAEGGDLVDLLEQRKRPLSEQQARFWYRQFGAAVTFMHRSKFEHGNIKCEKIVLDRDRRVCKLIDFAFTRKCFRSSTHCHLLENTFCPSAAFLAPEVLTSGRKRQVQRPRSHPLLDQLKSDVWSVGVVLFVLLHYRLPFTEWNLRLWIQSQLDEKYHCEAKLSTDAIDFIGEHLNPDYDTRATMEELMKHRWLRKGSRMNNKTKTSVKTSTVYSEINE